ncbi:MAG: nickel pincer cofactor biosynthesis protein LarC [Oscillospiraceae bacterium]|nr:nickel pincer cofactor biosynthesis protein LarC [Oscillospiraceae bacterium]
MKTLYIDCAMGAAGDMLSAALLELLPDRESFIKELNDLGIPGVFFEAEPAIKCGISGTHMSVKVHGHEEGSEQHHHDHHHSKLSDIEHFVCHHLPLSDKVRRDIMAVYNLIAQAESQVHGRPVDQIHFHEVGTLDAVADIAAVCLLMDRLSPEEVVVSPIHVGSGQVRCAHGILPVPAPATALLLKDVPIYGGQIRGELCTPTGAALLKHFASRFGSMPVMKIQAIGYGMGKKDFEAANCVRVMLGERDSVGDEIWELSCNVDDMSGEAIGFAMERLFEAGAVDVYTSAITMKKSRPGILLRVMCRDNTKDAVIRCIFKYTTTIGIREHKYSRHVLKRHLETVDTVFGPVRRKISYGYGVQREKYEYDDLSRIAVENGLSLEEVLKELE